MVSLRQIRSFVAVLEEGSFTAAAKREAVTQSGVSQHVKQLEATLGVELFKRDGRTVAATAAGTRYYAECAETLRRLDEAGRAIAGRKAPSSEPVRIGLMPTFTRWAMPPVLERFTEAAADAEVKIVEAYSGVLTDMVRAGELDFAVVPAFEGGVGLKSTLLIRDRELLVAAKGRIGRHLEPVRLRDLAPLRVVVPGPQNTRRRIQETYFATHNVRVARRLEFDAMLGTLEYVAQTDWVAVLPSTIMAGDADGARYDIRPIAEPALHTDFVMIEPARRALSPGARMFAQLLRAETEAIAGRWRRRLRQGRGRSGTGARAGAAKGQARGAASSPIEP